VRGSLAELAEAAALGRAGGPGGIPARGEFVLIVGASDGADPAAGEAGRRATAEALAAARAEVESLVRGGVARGEAARRVAAATGLPRRRLYGADPSR